MAYDWIKMRTDLYRDPKVCVIADHLMRVDGSLARYVSQNCQRDMSVTRNVMRNVTVGALVTLWGVTRHRGKRQDDDLLLRGVGVSVIDDIVDLPGFGEAMQEVGWVEKVEGGVLFPRFFEEYNIEPTENEKQKNAERQRRYREKRNALRNVTVTSQSNAREEKRREENISNKATPKNGFQKPDDVSEELWQEWVALRKKKGATVTATVVKGFRSKGDQIGWSLSQVLEKCVVNGWQGFEVDWLNKSEIKTQSNPLDEYEDLDA